MKEQLSALMDGELDSTDAKPLDAMKPDAMLRKHWGEYALIGDVLRGEPALSADFTDKVMALLEQEPTVLAPIPRTVPMARRSWEHVLPIAATLAGVAVVAWMGVRVGQPTGAPVLAQQNAGGQTMQVQDTERTYLLVHHGYAGTQAMPGVGYYMRTVSEQGGERAR